MHTLPRRIALFAAALAAPLAVALAAPAMAGDAIPQTARAESAPSAPQAARPALWKVADEDTTIYLFGTIHALPAGVDWFEGKVASAFGESRELVTEIVESDAARMQALVMSRAVLSDGQTLRAMLPPGERAEYEAALAEMGLPAQSFDRFEPWYAALGLSTLPMMRDGFASENGVEETLEARAKAAGQAHDALETPEYQLDLFDALPEDVQRNYLSEVVENLPTMTTDLRRMVEAWKRGDAEELARLMNAQEDDPRLVETLLTNRNRNWAAWIRKRLETPGSVFVAVGAGHLAGAGSVQEQLSAGGIAAERVQ